MKISLSWLNRYIDLSDLTVEKITDALPMIGLEVEEISTAGLPPLKNVLVGKILSFEKHPKADKLSVCQVDTGDKLPRQIVCGAKNFKTNDLVPVAIPGAILPGNFEIKISKLRDIESHGMMCSARELGLGDNHEGLLILTDRQLPVGTPLNDHYPQPDTILDLSITANRGDCLGHIGVARDLAAYFDRPLTLPQLTDNTPAAPTPDAPGILTRLATTTATCPYYTATPIKGVKIAPSPEWLQRDLTAVGLRPINNIVDITNWVMLETGHPLHAFDAAKITGHQINIRQAAAGEKIALLDQGKEITLTPDDTVIADEKHPLVIAGIMGGKDSGVTDTTTDIILEAAWFRPAPVRKTSRRLALSTDSSQRYTRDVDPAATLAAARRATTLILENAGGQVTGPRAIVGAPPRADRQIPITTDYVRARCGIEIPDETILNTWRRLGFTIQETTHNADAGASLDDARRQPADNKSPSTPTSPDDAPASPNRKSSIVNRKFTITVPSSRADIDRPIDLVEEFIRIHGTATIPAAPITAAAPGHIENDAPQAAYTRAAARHLAARGYAECYHYTLRDGREIAATHGQQVADALALANPLTSELGHIRPSLIPGLLDALKLNLAASNAPRRLFETGKVYRPAPDGTLRELTAVAFVILATPATRTWLKRDEPDFYTAKQLTLDLAALAKISPARLQFHPITSDTDAPLPRNVGESLDDAHRQPADNKSPSTPEATTPTSLPKTSGSAFSLQPSALWQPNHSATVTDRARQADITCGLIDAKTARNWDIKNNTVIAGEILLPPQTFATAAKRVRYQPFGSYPPVTRDLALVVDADTPAGEIADKLKTTATKILGKTATLETLSIFDLYEGDKLPSGKKSLAFALTLRAPDRTLTDAEITTLFQQLQTEIAKTYAIRK